MTGEVMGREKYGEISPKPPIFPGHNFTYDFCFAKLFLTTTNYRIISTYFRRKLLYP